MSPEDWSFRDHQIERLLNGLLLGLGAEDLAGAVDSGLVELEVLVAVHVPREACHEHATEPSRTFIAAWSARAAAPTSGPTGAEPLLRRRKKADRRRRESTFKRPFAGTRGVARLAIVVDAPTCHGSVRAMRVRAGDVSLWFEVLGTKRVADGPRFVERPTIITVHGGPGFDSANGLEGAVPLSELAQVVVFDQRGHGRSDYSTPDRWNLDTWADNIVALCAALEIERPIVLGSSFGGFVVQRYAARHPNHALAHVLMVTMPRFDNDQIVEVSERWAATRLPTWSGATSTIRRPRPARGGRGSARRSRAASR